MGRGAGPAPARGAGGGGGAPAAAAGGVRRGGAAQMLLLEGVPPHAALNESVEWAKRAVKPAAGGLVNAVLRRIAELVHGSQQGVPEIVRRMAWQGGRDEVPHDLRHP